jgi:hypothetical protein
LFEKRMLRRVFRPKRVEVAGGRKYYIFRRFIITLKLFHITWKPDLN